MVYKLTAVDESDPRWNPRMEAWWSQGGALLWNRFGGFGSDSMVLTEEEFETFLAAARAIEGWASSPHAASEADTGTGADHPVIVESCVEGISEDMVEPYCEDSPKIDRCCRDCGRPLHPSLLPFGHADLVLVPRCRLNHVMCSLEEAVSFGRGDGPNNFRTWEAMLEDLVHAIRARE